MDIIISGLSKKFGEKKIIENLSVRIKENTFTSIMAPSGWGKTTLLRILAGLETADEGRIEGLENKRISMVFQEDRLCSNLNAVRNVRLVCQKEIEEKMICEELGKIGLKGNEKNPVEKLSGGMKRRVAIVRAIMIPYDLLMLDEPFSGLDDNNKRIVIEYIKEKSQGKTVIIVTHEEEEAKAIGEKIIHLDDLNKK